MAVTIVLLAAAPATGHHVGAYVPRDNEVSANFKQLKFSIQARKFDVAARLFETGAIRVEMRARGGRIPSGLEEATRAALVAGDAPRAERGLMVFFAALIRDLALEADRRLADTREPDYITPTLLHSNPRAKEVYDRAMHDAWYAKNQLIDRGVPQEIALYLLPNAKSIRLVESGSLLHLLHKWTMRTCFNAQEEIYQSSLDEIAQFRAVHPQLAKYIGPPCYLRAGVTTPICTEGSHFCGIKVWLDFPNVTRRI